MAEDPKVSGRYRELPREEPPRALDDAILAASRRAVEARPAPLVAPTGRRRWYVPLAAAAVITLAVAVTLHIQHDRPGEEVDAVNPPMELQKTPKAEAPAAPRPFSAEPRADSAASAPAPAAPPAAQAERKRAEGAMAGARDSRAESRIARAAVEQSPESELERIAKLRAAGRHEEADTALAEFRKRYPEYRLTDEMRAKVEKPQ